MYFGIISSILLLINKYKKRCNYTSISATRHYTFQYMYYHWLCTVPFLVQESRVPCYLYGGILLPPTCKINYVNMRDNYVNMRLIYFNMQHNYVDMLHKYVNMRDNYVNIRLNFVACQYNYVAYWHK